MEPEGQMHVLLPMSVPTSVLIACAAAAIALWVAAHYLVRRATTPWGRAIMFVVRAALGIGAVWLAINALARVVTFATSWRLWACAILCGVGIELVVSLYRLERQTLQPGTRFALGALRLFLVVLLALVLAQPEFIKNFSETEQRYVAVLVDDSTSMDLTDPQASISEKLAWAEVLLPGRVPRAFRADRAAAALRDLVRRLDAQADWLSLMSETDVHTPREQVEQHRKTLIAALRETAGAAETTAEQVAKFAEKATSDAQAAARLKDVAKKLTEAAQGPLNRAAGAATGLTPARLPEQSAQLLEQLTAAQTALSEAADALAELTAKVDAVWFASLPEPDRKAIDEAAVTTRQAIAHAVLLGSAPEQPSIIATLETKYVVKFYRFASAPEEAAVAEWKPAAAPVKNGPEPPPERKATNLAAALEEVRSIPVRNLAGVLVLTDGRHNAKDLVEPAGRWFATQGVPICGVLIGSAQPPRDAAITRITAPRAVQLKDELVVRAELRVDGFTGKTIEVELVSGDKPVSQKKVAIPSATYRTTVELTHRPELTGLATYEVRIKPPGDERIPANNKRSVYVDVTDEPIKLLLIEERPRWEFRYIRNLFADRDRSVKLQHVLLKPDWIAGVTKPDAVHASVARGPREVEASALPKEEKDWLLFDVIILGDVPAARLGPDREKILDKFVGERGGRLIVIAGPNHMPHDYGSTLGTLLPVAYARAGGALHASAEAGFRITLTPGGESHIAMQLEKDEDLNRAAWAGVPDIGWRHPIEGAKPGANILAFAMPYSPPSCFTEEPTSEKDAEELAAEREAFARKNTLIATHRYGLGRVMMLTFGSTWRLRYRKGDLYHHRFWGQVLRWATADKLPAGNDFVRLGPDRAVYEPDEPVKVRARLRDKNHAAVDTSEVSLLVRRGDVQVLRKRLELMEGSPGMYSADLGTMKPGERYRLTLDVKDKDHPEMVANARDVSTEIQVEPAGSAELAELSADRSLLDSLAEWSNGGVSDPGDADKLLRLLGPGTRTISWIDPYPLWRSWPLLVLAVAAATAEWVIRKKVGLA